MNTDMRITRIDVTDIFSNANTANTTLALLHLIFHIIYQYTILPKILTPTQS